MNMQIRVTLRGSLISLQLTDEESARRHVEFREQRKRSRKFYLGIDVERDVLSFTRETRADSWYAGRLRVSRGRLITSVFCLQKPPMFPFIHSYRLDYVHEGSPIR